MRVAVIIIIRIFFIKSPYQSKLPATVLEAAKDKFKLLPLTHHHPNMAVDGHNFRSIAQGYTGENPYIDYLPDKKEVGIRSTMIIYDDEALDAYNRGEVQLSPGYIASFDWCKGTAPDGQEYDIIMKDIKDVNHLALLPCGRGGSAAVVLDKRFTIFDEIKAQTEDGAPYGNDNASKNHVKKETGSSSNSNKKLRENVEKLKAYTEQGFT